MALHVLSINKFAKTRNVIFEENKFHTFDSPALEATEIVNVVLPNDMSAMNDMNKLVDDLPDVVVTENVNVIPIQDEVHPHPPPPEPPLPPPIQQPVPDVAPTYEQTFMNQVNNLGSERVRNGPRRFDDECFFTESLLDDIAEPKSFKAS